MLTLSQQGYGSLFVAGFFLSCFFLSFFAGFRLFFRWLILSRPYFIELPLQCGKGAVGAVIRLSWGSNAQKTFNRFHVVQNFALQILLNTYLRTYPLLESLSQRLITLQTNAIIIAKCV